MILCDLTYVCVSLTYGASLSQGVIGVRSNNGIALSLIGLDSQQSATRKGVN